MPKLWWRRGRSGDGAAAVAERRGDGPLVALAPTVDDRFVDAIERAGGEATGDPRYADAVLWTEPGDPEGLREVLRGSAARWVQLPFAGIEAFFDAAVIDHHHTWTCAKGIYGPATAEHALALMLTAARQIHEHARAARWRTPGFGSAERRLSGARVLVVGTGGIGRALVQMLQPLDARVIAVNRSGRPLEGAGHTVAADRLPSVLDGADFVVLAAAATSDTRGMFDRVMLDYMKDDAWIVNVARGSLIVTDHLVEALRSGSIAGAALDVTDPEPLPEGHPLWSMDNVIITPHVANTWDMALPELAALVSRNVRRFASDEPLEGVVDVDLGY